MSFKFLFGGIRVILGVYGSPVTGRLYLGEIDPLQLSVHARPKRINPLTAKLFNCNQII